MEIIVTGATGYVGSNVLRRSVLDASITKIHVLSRRAIAMPDLLPGLPQASDKIAVIVHHDWLKYDGELLQQLKNARACIWCIGGRHTQTSRWPTPEEYLEVTVDYTLAAARAFAQALPGPSSKFRFVFCSGHATELVHHQSLLVMGPTRRAKGCAERGLFQLADSNPDTFDAVTVRPCGIFPAKETAMTWILTRLVLPHTVQVDDLATAMLHLAKHGSSMTGRIISCEAAEAIGREAIQALAQAS